MSFIDGDFVGAKIPSIKSMCTLSEKLVIRLSCLENSVKSKAVTVGQTTLIFQSRLSNSFLRLINRGASANSVFKNVLTKLIATEFDIVLAGKHRTFASSSLRADLTDSLSYPSRARIPLERLAAIQTP